MTNWLALLVVVVITAVLTGIIRRYAISRRLIDHPNERSSHTTPTPRGGGLALVVVILAGCVVLYTTGAMPAPVLIAVVGGGLAVATVGFVDDHGHLPARWRLLVHLLAASWAIWWLDFTPALPVAGQLWQLGWPGQLVAVWGLVWLVNLYNFMDGIDGIAGVEGLSVALAGAFILLSIDAAGPASWLALVGAACFGFLLWNWPPARIFMGDVGSGFLGYVLGVMVFATAADGLNLWCWAVLLGVFLVDSTVTLLRRLLAGQRWWEAHRSHAYQHAARRWRSHARISISVLLINLFWLAPLAWIGAHYPGWAGALAVLALAPLVGVALALGAGAGDRPCGPSAGTLEARR